VVVEFAIRNQLDLDIAHHLVVSIPRDLAAGSAMAVVFPTGLSMMTVTVITSMMTMTR
jgi:hypothetical protein